MSAPVSVRRKRLVKTLGKLTMVAKQTIANKPNTKIPNRDEQLPNTISNGFQTLSKQFELSVSRRLPRGKS